MRFRRLGSTGISVSTISCGAGPVSGLFTSTSFEAQKSVVARAVELGVNWFDTAATYGQGQSEASLGAALAGVRSERPLHVATKVRVQLTTQTDLRSLVVDSVKGSLQRLNSPRVTLLQIHNSITKNRNDQPTSITPEDVLGPTGLLAGMEDVRASGWVEHFGLTGIGDVDSLQTVMQSRRFATIQAPFHVLNPSALQSVSTPACDPNYGGFLRTAHRLGMGIFAIRVFAAGALLGAAPSSHTLQTPFFPVSLYRRDQDHARRLASRIGSMTALGETALRYVLSQPEIASAIVGLGALEHVEEAARIADKEVFSEEELLAIDRMVETTSTDLVQTGFPADDDPGP